MKLKIQYLILIGLVLPFIAVSCKSAAEKRLAAPTDQASFDELAEAKATAEEARSKAEAVNGSTYYPDQWGLAEDRYSAATDYETPKTNGEALTQITEWKALGVVYQDIYNRSLPYEQQRLTAAARENAVKTGADKLVPDRFAQADAVAQSAAEKLESGDSTGSVSAGKEAQDRYEILRIITEAHNKQAEADKNDFFSADPDNYVLAADKGNEAVDLYDEGKLPEAREAAEDALTQFNEVVRTGWVAKLEERTAFAEEARDTARDAKANIAAKQEYDAAEQAFNRANVAKNAGDTARAAELFDESGGLFVRAYNSTVTKRDRADDALRAAEQKLAESGEKAQAAEDLIGGE
jgi:hypothetical protein